MQHEWLIRVLEDLQTYARENRLSALADHLDQARLLAMTEIASMEPPSDPSPSDRQNPAKNGGDDPDTPA